MVKIEFLQILKDNLNIIKKEFWILLKSVQINQKRKAVWWGVELIS